MRKGKNGVELSTDDQSSLGTQLVRIRTLGLRVVWKTEMLMSWRYSPNWFRSIHNTCVQKHPFNLSLNVSVISGILNDVDRRLLLCVRWETRAVRLWLCAGQCFHLPKRWFGPVDIHSVYWPPICCLVPNAMQVKLALKYSLFNKSKKNRIFAYLNSVWQCEVTFDTWDWSDQR